MNRSRFHFSLLLGLTLSIGGGLQACSAVDDPGGAADDVIAGGKPVTQILEEVSPDTTWADLDAKKKEALERNAASYLMGV